MENSASPNPARPIAAAGLVAPGLGARVVGGGISSVGAQAAALLTSLVVTPFIIRLLGAEQYGLLTFINLLIAYLGFADLGMGAASTRFGAEALARDGERAEAAVVWTAALVTAIPAVAFAGALFLSAPILLTRVFGITQLPAALPALRIGAVVLLATAATGVLNTPQLTRMRVGLNSAITTAASIVQACLILSMLWSGMRLIAVMATMAAVAVATSCAHFFVSVRLSPDLLRPRLDRAVARRMLRYGLGIVVMAATGAIVVHGEKFVVVRMASVTDLAYYNVAYTLASLIGIFPAALMNPLMPALVHLKVSEERERSALIYGGMLRGLLFWTVPAALAVCVAARPFFTLWAGPSFGIESTLPLCILAAGWLFQSASYLPRCALAAAERVDIVARYQVYELVPYFLAVVALVARFGIRGAATAWVLRVAFECWLLFRAARRVTGMRAAPLEGHGSKIAAALALLLGPVVAVRAMHSSDAVLIATAAVSIAIYSLYVYRSMMTPEERDLALRVLRVRRA
jgi:O-antigen/teichoic acid export membrane protein